MAIEIKKRFAVDLSAVVNSGIDSVRAVRRREQAQKEAEFQKAITDGLSYNDQLTIRNKQLDEAKASNLFDADYIETLNKSIADTKKLGRFSNYRTKYAVALADLSAGKINEINFLNTLQNQLVGIEDPDLRLEVQNNIADATVRVKQYNDTILSNQVKKAQYDGTQAVLNDAVSRVKSARSDAAVSGNQDEVTAYDLTLSALGSQLSATKIQDAVTNFQVTSATRGTTPVDKLNFVNDQLSGANGDTPIKIGDKTYNSAQQFWQVERENYLAGSSKIFGNFFQEVENKAKSDIGVEAAKFGYPTAQVLDATLKTLNDIKSRPEVQPYLANLANTQTSIMGDAVDALSKKILEVGEFNTQFREANTQLQSVSAKYGIDTTTYQISLAGKLANLVQANIISPEEAKTLAPDVNINLPTLPTTPAPTTPNAVGGGGTYTVKSGDNLSTIARNAGMSLTQVLDLNPQYKANPNLIRTGQVVNLGAPAAAPAAPAAPAPAATPTAAPTPAPATPTSTPSGGSSLGSTNYAKAASYSGGSIVDFLSLAGQPSDYTARAKIAASEGISNYTGTATQNIQLLNALKSVSQAQSKAAQTPAPVPAPSGGGSGGGGSPSPAPTPTPPPSGGGGSPAPTPTPPPAPRPTPPPAPTPPPPPPPAPRTTTYVVRSGDNLSRIASQYGVSTGRISGYRSGNPNLIYPGEVLTISF